MALVCGKVAHERCLSHEAAQIGNEFIQMFVGAKRMLQPIIDEGLSDWFEDSKRVAAISGTAFSTSRCSSSMSPDDR